MKESFAHRLSQALSQKKTPVLLGLDPRPDLIPDDCFSEGKNSPEAVSKGVLNFGCRLLDALEPHIAAVKPQIAFYEALGLQGLEAYAKTIAYARKLGVLVVADIKRGDIGSTAEAYAAAHLAVGAPFEADAVTLNPWLGEDSLKAFFDHIPTGKGVYLLLHTSNSGSKDLQELETKDGAQVYQCLAKHISRWQESYDKGSDFSSIGAVVGATFPAQLEELHKALARTPLLVPGYGSQGGTGKDVACLYRGGLKEPHIINASRSISFAWKKEHLSLEEGALQATLAMRDDILHSASLT